MKRIDALKLIHELLTNRNTKSRLFQRFAKEAMEIQGASSKWFRSKGVQGIGVARRTTQGQRLAERVLKVYVERKLPLSKLNESVIPKEIRIPFLDEPIPIDVEAIGRLGLQSADLQTHQMQIFPGLSISAGDNRGTLGCLVRRRGGAKDLYILSNAHVLGPYNGTGGDGKIFQPGVGASDSEVVAELAESVVLDFTVEGHQNTADAAIAKLRNPAAAVSGVPYWGLITGDALCREGTPVRLLGSVSGLREGVVIDSNFAPTFDYLDSNGNEVKAGFQYQVLCTSIDDEPFTRNGDSGSIVLNSNNQAVGLHFAGVDAQKVENGKPGSVFSPIGFVLNALDIELVTDALGTPPPIELELPGSSSFFPSVTAILPRLIQFQQFHNSVKWRLTGAGLEADGRIEGTLGELVTVPRVWRDYGESILGWARHFQIPVELVLATICTESSGNKDAVRIEPDGRRSVGLMQTLIGTAQDMVPSVTVTEEWLKDPDNSIRAGCAYIDHQRGQTVLDPPRVACAYNAGGIYKNDSSSNRWKMRQYPIGTGQHADRFVEWFNDCFRMFERDASAPDLSFYRLLRS